MRKKQKEELLAFIKNMHEAHREIQTAVEKQQKASAQNMLSELQELALSFGETLEKLEGEGFRTVAFVEEYCEVLYQVFEQLDSIDGYKVHRQLEKALLKIENSVKKDIAAKTEIVFFPYKASMWDSLESIYLAAKKDPTCEVYCVPIPYYDRNPDGSFGQMHYEGGDFPVDISVTLWNEFSLENHRPDIAYIHNPYDQGNYVTSVYPKFYAQELKKYVDKLVYVPYFIFPAEFKSYFALTSGVLQSDLIFVQNEETRNGYIDTLSKAILKIDRAYWENKIIAIGSPKTDKIINLKREKIDISDEWLERIGHKKIIFFNTNLNMILNNPSYVIENLKEFLRLYMKLEAL